MEVRRTERRRSHARAQRGGGSQVAEVGAGEEDGTEELVVAVKAVTCRRLSARVISAGRPYARGSRPSGAEEKE